MSTRPVAVVVLGDLARSPRMLAHVRALARHDVPVQLVGYVDKPLDVPSGVHVHPLHPLPRAPEHSSRARFIASAGLRMSALFAELSALLVRLRPGTILVQNPPSFPSLSACAIAARACNAKLIVDWHNYGHTLLALRLSPDHKLVQLSRSYEYAAATRAHAHLCVSRAMQHELAERRIQAHVLYDRPLHPEPLRPHAPSRTLVCPTGFTSDEDVPLLLDALALLASRIPAPIDVHITGDGPLRPSLQARAHALQLSRVRIHFGYLPRSDYAALLARAELGISLHRSSSGVDLAMKVVDMFEAQLPVCALDVGTSLPEQVEHGITGMLFRNADELATHILTLLSDPARTQRLREHVTARWQRSWFDHWDEVTAPLLDLRAP